VLCKGYLLRHPYSTPVRRPAKLQVTWWEVELRSRWRGKRRGVFSPVDHERGFVAQKLQGLYDLRVLSEPADYQSSAREDFAHRLDLVISLYIVCLVDTKSVDPDETAPERIPGPRGMEKGMEVISYKEGPAVDLDGMFGLF
jgi:hypothetical protein